MKRFIFIVSLLCLTGIASHAVEAGPWRNGFFANAKQVFPPLMADPREVATELRLVSPVGKQLQGEVKLGEYFGLYRWTLPWEESYVQWSIAGAAFPRFNLVTERKDFEIVDYIAQMPVDVRVGHWATRLMPYHISSHLGDDFILRTGELPQKYSFDSFKHLLSYDLTGWRFYGGYNYIIRNEHLELGRWAAQSGFEWHSPWWAGGHAQAFWANDLQNWERTGWNPQFVSQLGVKIANSPTDMQAVSIYTEFGAGHEAYGQFFTLEETHWVLGLRFDI